MQTLRKNNAQGSSDEFFVMDKAENDFCQRVAGLSSPSTHAVAATHVDQVTKSTSGHYHFNKHNLSDL